MKDLSQIKETWYDVPEYTGFTYTNSGRIEYKGQQIKGRMLYLDGELMWYDDVESKLDITPEQTMAIIYDEIDTGHDIRTVTQTLFLWMDGLITIISAIEDLLNDLQPIIGVNVKTGESLIYSNVLNAASDTGQSIKFISATLNGERKSNKGIVWLYASEEEDY
ncbi:hypothetical protein [Lactococcus phage P087]|uniref:Uncharacterized protein n=1 Tax=Lactococcus phage P087 TaxID=641487 RepID=C3U2N8_9CAUD|nr:hypothetical protein P087_gp48 [Lactococcus phage P087]ACP41724.1 hypothetical protein [Lactococcus phage P087]